MDVNVQYNLKNFTEFQPDFGKISTEKISDEKISETADKEQFQTAREIRQAKTDEKVMMDLKDVQNFLYMLIGSEIKVSEEDRVPGTALDLSA